MYIEIVVNLKLKNVNPFVKRKFVDKNEKREKKQESKIFTALLEFCRIFLSSSLKRLDLLK